MIFDQHFKDTISSPFEITCQFIHPETEAEYDLVGIFCADQERTRINGRPVKETIYTLEFDVSYLTQLPIAPETQFVINGSTYKVTSRPFTDEIGWTSIDLILKNAA